MKPPPSGMVKEALLEAMSHDDPKSPGHTVEGSPADDANEMCCPKCGFCGPETRFEKTDNQDEPDHEHRGVDGPVPSMPNNRTKGFDDSGYT